MNNMKLRFLNVGYGESILLTAQKRDGAAFAMLIDGGSGEDAEYAGFPARVRAADALREMGLTGLDVLLNTHIHEDHTCGLARVASEFEIGEYWCCALPEGHEAWPELPEAIITLPRSEKSLRALNEHRRILKNFRSRGTPVRQLRQGTEIALPVEGLSLSVLGPSSEEVAEMLERIERLYAEQELEAKKELLLDVDKNMNNHSVMLMLNCRGTKVLLPGDTNCAGYDHLPPQALRADVFKVGHHGQRDGADEALVQAVSPRVLVVCASSDRRYESMHPEILSLFRAHDPNTVYLLSDTPNLPPWTDGVPAHKALELTLGTDGEIQSAYIPV
jgi:beta-lactamase superfamily II metal-dependent hydrolase